MQRHTPTTPKRRAPRTPGIPRTPGAPHRRTLLGRARDRGQVAIEYVGLLPVLLLIGLCLVQLGLAVYAVQQAGTAARAGARAASQRHTFVDYQTAGQAAISDWLDASVYQSGFSFDSVEVTARVEVPSIVPGVGFGTAERSVTMPRD